MERQLRTNIGFPGTPLRLIWRGKAAGESKPGVRVASPPPATSGKAAAVPRARKAPAAKAGAPKAPAPQR
jgi:hypothetical protein